MVKFWDPHSQYMKDAREAARRGKHITRVFIVENFNELDGKPLIEQMKLDFEAGIQIFLCRYNDIESSVEVPDFGITDDSYVCLVPYDKKTRKAHEIELNSSDEMMEMARKWKVEILNHAYEITDVMKDIQEFKKKFTHKNS